MSHVIAIANQKGGVGKTTSAINLATELVQLGYQVLLVDLDPQGNASSGLSVTPNDEGEDLYDVFFDRVALSDVIKPSVVEGLDLAPSSKDLISVELELGKTPGRELILKSEVELLQATYDYILIDCPPSSGLLTLNALGAARRILIPLQAEYYALEGISSLLDTVEFVQQTYNPELLVLGVFLTMYDSRTNLAKQVEEEARSFFPKHIFSSVVPRNIRLAESPSHGLPIRFYAPGSAGAVAYESLASEVADRCAGKGKKRATA